jgi:hypothetical protein
LARSGPARLFRYLTYPPGGTFSERYEAMSEQEKAQERRRSAKRNGFFLAFVDMKARGRAEKR